MPAPIAVGAGRSSFYPIDINFSIGCGACGLWAKASISLLSELAREAGEAVPFGEADRPHIHRPSS
jgi:hypothetical protein